LNQFSGSEILYVPVIPILDVVAQPIGDAVAREVADDLVGRVDVSRSDDGRRSQRCEGALSRRVDRFRKRHSVTPALE
jgi:hypothetical protein